MKWMLIGLVVGLLIGLIIGNPDVSLGQIATDPAAITELLPSSGNGG